MVLDAWSDLGVKEQEELSQVPRGLSELEMRWPGALQVERRSYVTR